MLVRPVSASAISNSRRRMLMTRVTPSAPAAPKPVPDEELNKAKGAEGKTPEAGQEEADKQPMLPAEKPEGKKAGEATGPALGNAAGDKGA